uniref:Heterokaryon incompatibility n=1 Tax=Colletotrichum fructicola (strain Nara gc5) TaxID=1213859 RepID=L2FIE4_COLFN
MDYTSNFINGASLDRREWALRESVRRNVCLNFGFELLVDADFSGGKAATCGYDKVAVPTGRYLWEPVSNVEWSARYKKMEAEIRKKPLKKREIRLLIVDPMDIAVNTVHASMEIVSLDDQPEYDALSYVWASSSPPRGERGKLYVDGHILDVTQTLLQALRSIGSYQKTLSRRIWVDAVCINQQDHREKSWQILLMASIYRLASTTYIFTDDNLQGIRAASKLDARKFRADINHFKRTAGDQNADRPQPELKQDNIHVAIWRDSSQTSRNWRAIKLLLSHPWWGRRWVIQEAFFSRNPVLICGSASDLIPLDKIAQIAVWYQKVASSAHKMPEFIQTLFDSCPFYPLLREWKSYRTDPDVHRAPLPRWMTLAKDFKQSLSRDMVFGLLSLASPEDQLRIKPDYYRSDKTVFTSIFAYLTKTYGINPVRFRSLEFKKPLPSWCGIWGPRYQAEAGSILHFAARRGRKSFKVGAGTKRVAQVLENPAAIGRGETNKRAKVAGPIDNSVLGFQGIYFDEVAVAIPSGITAKTVHTSSMASIEESFQLAIQCWQKRWAGLKNDPYGSGNDFPWDVCRTLLGDWTEGLTDEEWLAHYQLWLKGVSCWQAPKCKRGLSFGAWKCPETGLNDTVGREDCFYRSSRICCYNRSLMITARGFIGLAPLETMVGDTISVFYGSLIPLVLRRNGDGEMYSLVGETYVHGIMYREAVETRNESCPEREFLLS